MPPRIWQPEHPTPGWIEAEKDSDLTVYLPLERELVVPMHFRLIPAGEFRMGSWAIDFEEIDDALEPVNLVKILESFYIGTFPVTQIQYRAIATAYRKDLQLKAIDEIRNIDPSYSKGDLRSVEQVSWFKANGTGRWLAGSDELKVAMRKAGELRRGSRVVWTAGLPNEALWEYACRAGTETDHSRGDGWAALDEVASPYNDWETGITFSVGELPANDWGLHDMHSSLWEWCADVWDCNAYRKRFEGWTAAAWSEADAGKDAKGKGNHRHRVVRGGSRGVVGRSAVRGHSCPRTRIRSYGFRLCVFPEPVKLGRAAEPGAEPAAAAAEPRDQAEQTQAGDGVPMVDLRHATFPPPSGGNDI